MIHLRIWLCLAILLAAPIVADAQPKRAVDVIFKDGFHIKGIVNETVREMLWDRGSGRPFPVFSGNFFIDDNVREVSFSPGQILQVRPPKDVKPSTRIVLLDTFFQPRDILAGWEFTGFGKWSDAGERQVTFRGNKGLPGEMTQRVAMITPYHITVITKDYKWNMRFFTQEFGPELTRKIVLHAFGVKKELKALSAAEKYVKVAEFMHEAGWLKEAEHELLGVIENYPDDKKRAEELLLIVKKDRAELFVEDLKQASNVGQHQVALGGLDEYDREGHAKIVSPELRLAAQDLRTKYKKLDGTMAEMRAFLKELPALTKTPPAWNKAYEFITEELNYDTAARLDEFLVSAQQYDLERKNKRAFSQSAEQVLATAISGWLQGSQAALPDADAALKLAAAREFVLEYLKGETPAKRASLLSSFARANDLPVDVMARLVRMIPPPFAQDAAQLNTDVQTLTIEVPDADGGTYFLKLPPDYHHQRSYPVLLLLHSGRDKADETLARFSEEAAKNGFILAVPQWAGKGFRSKYQNGTREQALVIDTLRDLRRRFQVDSDRVFLFGWEDGANMAFDVALGHPDLFAGVAPMNGGLLPFTRKFYWPNAQYLPFYVIGGERDGHSKQMRELFKDWTSDPYACVYVEYKGRSSEWFGLEIPKMLSWMKNKKRLHPTKEMGRPNNSRILGEEFHSTRTFNNRFYWLRGDQFATNVQNDHLSKTWPGAFLPAVFQANLTVGNRSEKDEAKIWNQLNLNARGMKKVTFLITPGMLELKHPLKINLNGQVIGGMRKIQPSLETLLEELWQSGDRQRLYVAKVEL